MKQSDFDKNFIRRETPKTKFEDHEPSLNRYQKMAYTRWAKKYGYRTWQGYLTARQGYKWKDYTYLREHSP
jgi:hypothetical protein